MTQDHKFKVGDRFKVVGSGGYDEFDPDKDYYGTITQEPHTSGGALYTGNVVAADGVEATYLFFASEIEPVLADTPDLEDRVAALEAAVFSCDDRGTPLDGEQDTSSEQGEWFDVSDYISKTGIVIRPPLIHGEPATSISINTDGLTITKRPALPHKSLEQWAAEVEEVNRLNGWFDQGRPFAADIALLHSEVSEAYEGYRNGDWANVHEELADVFIRLMDTVARYDVDLAGETQKKLDKNRTRGYKHGGKAE